MIILSKTHCSKLALNGFDGKSSKINQLLFRLVIKVYYQIKRRHNQCNACLTCTTSLTPFAAASPWYCFNVVLNRSQRSKLTCSRLTFPASNLPRSSVSAEARKKGVTNAVIQRTQSKLWILGSPSKRTTKIIKHVKEGPEFNKFAKHWEHIPSARTVAAN